MAGQAPGEKKRPTALNLTPKRSPSSSSSDSSIKGLRTPRFAEATSVHSPVDGKSPFDDPEPAEKSKPADVGFGYISNSESRTISMAPKTPLKSAMKVPGTPGRINNPMSPTFREDVLERREKKTTKEQKRDLAIKTRVRMAKFALRGVNFSCSLIILAMLSSSMAIFYATKSLPGKSHFNAWSPDTVLWPQILVLTMASISLLVCVGVFVAYCRGGHRRAEKVGTYYTMFAIGWFILSMVLWLVTAALFQHSKNDKDTKDTWSWACADNTRKTDYTHSVDYELVCRLQNWALVCIIIEVVVEVICIALYSIIFYRYYTKRRLAKSMDMRDRARSDLYLAQLRSQSAPNTPGFAGPMKSPALSQYAMSPRHPPAAYRNLADISEDDNAGSVPFTPGGRVVVPQSQFNNRVQDGFKLQAPPSKAPSATPKTQQEALVSERPASPPSETVADHAPMAANEPVYDSVPIPGAYADQAVKSPPPTQTNFSHAR